MAEPGDPTTPPPTAPTPTARPTTAPEVDHDDLIGFSSAARLEGRPRSVTPPEPAAAAEGPDRDLFEGEPVATSPDGPPVSEPVVQPFPSPSTPAPSTPAPSWATETPVRAPVARARTRAAETQGDVENATGLYAVYALILFAVPTLGVSALVALLAVTGRAGPSHPVAASHFVFQQRTLWVGGVAALLGGILIAVGLGVFVLFIVAVWLILRGTSGTLALKAGRPVRDPRGWFLA